MIGQNQPIQLIILELTLTGLQWYLLHILVSTKCGQWGGVLASNGVVSVAETGSTSTIFREMADAGGDVLDSASAERAIFNSNTRTAEIGPLQVDASHAFLSTISMIAPSPDWFTGFYNYDLIDTTTSTWLESFTTETYPWDAGSDHSTTYDSPNVVSDPQEPISRLTVDTVPSTGVFLSPDSSTVLPVATWFCSISALETSVPTTTSIAPTGTPTSVPIPTPIAPIATPTSAPFPTAEPVPPPTVSPSTPAETTTPPISAPPCTSLNAYCTAGTNRL